MTSIDSLTPITSDEVIYHFLSNSAHTLPSNMKSRFVTVKNNKSWKEKAICRELMRELGHLDLIVQREWFAVQLSPYQLRRVFLGEEGDKDCNNFSRYYSNNTFRIDIAAKNIIAWEPQTGLRKKHRDVVLAKASKIQENDLSGIILCASRGTINRKLKCFDGNHRLIAYHIRYGHIKPFRCIIGLERNRIRNLLQRILLGFPVANKLKFAILFRIKRNFTRLISLIRGGVNYQPMFKNLEELKEISDLTDKIISSKYKQNLSFSERPCIDRARLIHTDITKQIGNPHGTALLDIGCNIGFFCHYFQSIGMQTTGIDNNRHNRIQLFTLANSIKVAKRMNRIYGLSSTFYDIDAKTFLENTDKTFDVVLLLSVIHHFFTGYSLDKKQYDGITEAKIFLKNIVHLTKKLLYIEYDETCKEVSADEFVDFLHTEMSFRNVEVIGRSADFNRPIIRCLCSKSQRQHSILKPYAFA